MHLAIPKPSTKWRFILSGLVLLIASTTTSCSAADRYTADYMPAEYRNATPVFSELFPSEKHLSSWSVGNVASWDPQTGHAAKGAAKISPSAGPYYFLGSHFAVTPGDYLAASCWVKTDRAGGVKTELVFYDKNNGRLGAFRGGTPFGIVGRMTHALGGTHDWSMLLLNGSVPANSATARFVVRNAASQGTVWVDDITVARIGKAEDIQAGELDRHPIKLDVKDISPREYVRIRDGHLVANGKRLRVWSAQGSLHSPPTHRGIDLEVQRFKEHGFNGLRTLWWWHEVDDNYTKGDLSKQDRKDYLLARLGQQGVRVWNDVLNSCRITPEHVNVIDDPATAQQWSDAVREMLGKAKHTIIRSATPLHWDPRMQEIYFNYIKKTLNHRNKHNGLRYADDPAFYAWELSNEEWWYQRILWGKFLKLPEYFQKSFYAKWNQWLKKEYGSTRALQRAWTRLLPGEDLEKQTIMFLTAKANQDMVQMAKVLGLDVKLTYSKAGLSDFSPQRGRDVMRFLADMHIAFKRKAEKVFRSQGVRNKGCSVVPLVWDTNFSGRAFSQYLQSYADVTAVGMYLDMSTHNSKASTFPFASALNSPPLINDWFDNRRVLGKPTFLYENMFFAPQKYRAEYAYRLLALAATQDFDVVDFHYYGHPRVFPTMKNPYTTARMQYMHGAKDTYGLGMRDDEVLMATVKVAGEIFKKGYLKPAANPVVAVLGKNTIFNIHDLNYGAYSLAARYTAFQKGFCWDFRPHEKKDKVRGKLIDLKTLPANKVVKPTREIQYRWKEGILVLDSRQCKAIVGFVPSKYRFKGGTLLSGITVHTPKGMPFKIDGERYAAIGIVSEDGKPLRFSKKITISAVNTSFNSGFSVDLKKMAKDTAYAHGLGRSITNIGSRPIVAGRVGLTITASWLKGKHYRMLDYDNNCLQEGTCDRTLTIPSDQKVYLVELSQ